MKSTMSFAEKSSNTAQLTIFYDGGVNVYDNVSAEKVKPKTKHAANDTQNREFTLPFKVSN